MEPLPERAEGPRLLLRRYVEADAQQLGEAVTANLEHLRPYMAWTVHEPLTLDQRRRLILQWEEAWRAGGDLVVGVYLGDAQVGSSGLHRRLGPDALEIGYWVDHRHLRRGFATEISTTLTDLAFSVPGIERVEIHHDLTNTASEGVPRGLGFEDVGEVPSPREHPAPAECGIDRRWCVCRERWAKMRV